MVEKDVEQKTELVKNLISNARIVLTLDPTESEFRADLTKTDFKILEQLLKNPKEKLTALPSPQAYQQKQLQELLKNLKQIQLFSLP